MLASKPGVYALERASKAGVPGIVVARKSYAAPEEYDAALLAALREHRIDVVVLAVQRVLLRPSKEKEPQSYSPLVQAIARQSGDKAAREAADRLDTRRDMRDRMAHSLSFGLLMTCLGLCVILTVVICHVF